MILDDRQETSTGTTMGSNSASGIILKHAVSGKRRKRAHDQIKLCLDISCPSDKSITGKPAKMTRSFPDAGAWRAPRRHQRQTLAMAAAIWRAPALTGVARRRPPHHKDVNTAGDNLTSNPAGNHKFMRVISSWKSHYAPHGISNAELSTPEYQQLSLNYRKLDCGANNHAAA
ncbi:hypothetical protein [Camelimonas lactis]|uniref:hypothetical protein n=1 Tax=Camelimonas lactis TaxID=659006 RepID=UPI001051631B|nr:hypothetical protein [Camelimonas lactis]